MEGEAPSRRVGEQIGEAEYEEGEESVEEEEYEDTEGVAALAGTPEALEAPNQALSNQPLVSQEESNFLTMMEKINQFMGKLTQKVASREKPKSQAFKTPSMKLASHPPSFDRLQEHIDIKLELYTRYHEGQKEKNGSQEEKPPATGSNSLRPHKDSFSKKPHNKKKEKGKNFQGSKDKPNAALHNKDNKVIGSEKERRIKEGLLTYCCGKNPIEKLFNRPGPSRGFPSKQGKA
ncbi:hypothetical protein O181_060565 [Austropuccinia psidii MF-1]|uniref:Uncharacterized protein n=1 Tax=Austropuccinia psidii MF-1 TaxID=1389203 RepID=A0A9Q3EKQ6_9BASI|nr:hypothetical protein [Austropuccinia psidii MF-1]